MGNRSVDRYRTAEPDDRGWQSGDVHRARLLAIRLPRCSGKVSTDGGATFANIPGATTTNLTFTTTQAENGDQYQAVFTNAVESVTTAAATLTVQTAPAITTDPVSQSIVAGSPVTFTAAATGDPTPTVQWQVSTDGGATFTNVPGATTTSLTFTTTLAQSGNQYQAVFTNAANTATTTAASR